MVSTRNKYGQCDPSSQVHVEHQNPLKPPRQNRLLTTEPIPGRSGLRVWSVQMCITSCGTWPMSEVSSHPFISDRASLRNANGPCLYRQIISGHHRFSSKNQHPKHEHKQIALEDSAPAPWAAFKKTKQQRLAQKMVGPAPVAPPLQGRRGAS